MAARAQRAETACSLMTAFGRDAWWRRAARCLQAGAAGSANRFGLEHMHFGKRRWDYASQAFVSVVWRLLWQAMAPHMDTWDELQISSSA